MVWGLMLNIGKFLNSNELCFLIWKKKQSHSKIEIFGGLLLKMLESKTMSNTDIVYTALEK